MLNIRIKSLLTTGREQLWIDHIAAVASNHTIYRASRATKLETEVLSSERARGTA